MSTSDLEQVTGSAAAGQSATSERSWRALGFSFDVLAAEPWLQRYFRRIFECFAVEESASHRYSLGEEPDHPSLGYTLSFDGAIPARFRTCEGMVAHLIWHVNRKVIEHSQDLLLIHAAAAEREGSAIVLPAAMESGKTTLVAGLVRAGFRYLTDETVGIDMSTGKALPFPRSLSVDPGSWEVLADLRPQLESPQRSLIEDQWQVPPRTIRADAVAPPCLPRFVISPRYVAGATTRFEPLTRAQALSVLAENSFNLRAHGRSGIEMLAQVARRSTCRRLVIGDLDEACRLVEDLVRHPEAPSA